MTEKAFFSFVAFIGGPFLFLPSLEEAASGRGHHWKGERKRERERERIESPSKDQRARLLCA